MFVKICLKYYFVICDFLGVSYGNICVIGFVNIWVIGLVIICVLYLVKVSQLEIGIFYIVAYLWPL